jgi:hypothetical protein
MNWRKHFYPILTCLVEGDNACVSTKFVVYNAIETRFLALK